MYRTPLHQTRPSLKKPPTEAVIEACDFLNTRDRLALPQFAYAQILLRLAGPSLVFRGTYEDLEHYTGLCKRQMIRIEQELARLGLLEPRRRGRHTQQRSLALLAEAVKRGPGGVVRRGENKKLPTLKQILERLPADAAALIHRLTKKHGRQIPTYAELGVAKAIWNRKPPGEGGFVPARLWSQLVDRMGKSDALLLYWYAVTKLRRGQLYKNSTTRYLWGVLRNLKSWGVSHIRRAFLALSKPPVKRLPRFFRHIPSRVVAIWRRCFAAEDPRRRSRQVYRTRSWEDLVNHIGGPGSACYADANKEPEP